MLHCSENALRKREHAVRSRSQEFWTQGWSQLSSTVFENSRSVKGCQSGGEARGLKGWQEELMCWRQFLPLLSQDPHY